MSKRHQMTSYLAIACNNYADCLVWAISHDGEGDCSYSPGVRRDILASIYTLRVMAKKKTISGSNVDFLLDFHQNEIDTICDFSDKEEAPSYFSLWEEATNRVYETLA